MVLRHEGMRMSVACLIVVLSSLAVLGQPSEKAQRPKPEEIEQAIKQLGDPRFSVRSDASKFLWHAGRVAEAAVREAAKSKDPEVAYRARTLLDKFQYGIYPDTPHDVVQLIQLFRDGDINAKRSALAQLQQRGQTRTLMMLLKLDLPENLRIEFRSRYLQNVDKTVPALLVDGDVEQAEELLELASVADIGMQNYAVYLLLSEKIDEKISKLQSRLKEASNATDAKLLMYLLRATGDLQAARDPAQTCRLENDILYEARDWKELAKLHPVSAAAPGAEKRRKEPAEKADDPFGAQEKERSEGEAPEQDVNELTSSDVERLGYVAAYHRLAGNKKEFKRVITRLKTLPKYREGDWLKEETSWYRAEAMFANDHVTDAVEILMKTRPASAFILLVQQNRYQEAFQLAGVENPHGPYDAYFDNIVDQVQAKPKESLPQFNLSIEVIRVIHRVGHGDEAERRLAQLADAVQNDEKTSRLNTVCRAEYRLGLLDNAFKHAAIVFAKQDKPYVLRNFFTKSLPTAEALWEFVGDKEQAVAPRLEQLHRLVKPKKNQLLTTDELKSAVDAIQNKIGKSEDATKRAIALHALGDLCLRQDDSKLAIEVFKKAVNENHAPSLIRLGDLAAKGQEWDSAANWYEEAWKKGANYPQDTSGLFLSGNALLKAGNDVEARRRMRLARLLPLAGSSRRSLAEALRLHGLHDEALAEYELIMRTALFQSWDVNNAAQQIGNLVSKTDPLLAADCWERLLLSILKTSSAFVQTEGYLKLPHLVHKSRARGLIAKGNVDAAIPEIWLSYEALPGDVPLAEDLVPELREVGREDVADQLFEKVYQQLVAVARDFPDSSLHLNNAAWLAAKCDRKLDEAIVYAKRAVELTPGNLGHLDTLAEVHFRCGEVELAIKYAQQCLEGEPKNEHFIEQLKRFEGAE